MVQVRVSDSAWKKISKDRGSALYQVLEKAIPEELAIITSDARVDIMASTYGYIMHSNTFLELKKTIKYWGLNSRDAHNILHAVLENYEANLGLRQATLICLQKQKNKEKINYTKMLRQCDLSPDNEIMLRSLGDISFGSRSLLSKVKEDALLFPYEIRNNCEKTMDSINPFIARLVYKKLSFIVKYNKYEHKDLISDLVRKGIETYYRVTPYVTELHRVNSVKQSIHNQAMKEISFYTSKKRARIEKTGDGEYSTKIDSIVDQNDRVLENKMVDVDWQVPTLNFELKRFVQQYNKNNNSRDSIVSKLLCDEEDVAFTQFVRSKLRLNDSYSMESIHYKRPKAYVTLIAEYHDIPELTVKRIAYELLKEFNGNSDKTTKL